MRIAAIVAVADNGVIGNQGKLPWHLPADMEHFKRLTMGHHILMGRKTYHSIGRPLPGRISLVLSRDGTLVLPKAKVFTGIEDAIMEAQRNGENELFVIGGAEVFRLALPYLHRIYLTQVHASPPGDVYMPSWGEDWTELQREERPADEKNIYPYTFVTLVRQFD
ncbi:MAG: dihydrofolate reductase [Cytophagales bacterium]|nr:dihydrofolate reductase [Bernardetiaceae bacterium]MDW8209541.1 dihydrofolate reductase [Cytophagales bacterium]